MFSSFMGDEEYTKFVKTLQEKLPVTFRINAGEINYHVLSKELIDKDFVKSHAIEAAQGDEESKQD